MAALSGQIFLRLGRQQVPPVLGVTCSGHSAGQRRHASYDVVKGQTSNLAAYRRGQGGRSSFSGLVTTVLGAGGFTGRYIVNQLGKMGSQVICPYRGDSYYHKHLKLAGDLGQILFLDFDLKDEETLRKTMKYSNVVINLIGREWETRNYSFHDVHVEGARRVARIARECGVEKLIHFSHLNASPNPTKHLLKSSAFLKSKYEGELAVREEFPEAVIFKPSDIYGQEDRFINYYMNSWRRLGGGYMPLWKKGEQTIKRPVYVSDIAEGVINAIFDPDAAGNSFECVGPHSYYLRDLVEYFYRQTRYSPFHIGDLSILNPAAVAFLMKTRFCVQLFPAYPIVSMEKLEMDSASDVLQGLRTLSDLGVQLTEIESVAKWELRLYKTARYYQEELGEFETTNPPRVLA